MCLTINHRNKKTATKPIPIYKILLHCDDGTISAPYRTYYDYKIGEIIEDVVAENIVKSGSIRTVYSGFIHAFKTLTDASKVLEAYKKQYENNLKRLKATPCIYKAEIPKGSKYYEGDKHDICSKQILIIKQV